jgi:hypothetical protein
MNASLIDLLGNDNGCILDLDITYPSEDKFNQNLKECLRYKTVIGMVFHGNSHTTNPSRWLSQFRNQNYRILSVILHATKELCFIRCESDPGDFNLTVTMSLRMLYLGCLKCTDIGSPLLPEAPTCKYRIFAS